MGAAGETTETILSPEEWQRLEELDSRQFGFLNLRSPENLHDVIIIQKAIRVLEQQLLDGKRPSGDCAEEDVKTYLKLGHLHLLAEDFPKALSAYQRVFALEKDNCWKDPTFFYGLGLVYFHFRTYQYASEAFRQVLYVAPCFERSNEIHLRLGLVFKALEEWDLALKHFQCAFTESQPCTLGKLEIEYHICHCYDLRGDLREAKQLYEQLWHKHPPTHVKACICRQLGWIFYRADFLSDKNDPTARLNQAVEWLKESLQFEPTSGSTYYYLGRCFSAIPGRAHDAFVNYRHSIDKSEASADTWCSIGYWLTEYVLYQQQNQPMDALQAFVCAVQLDGHHSAAWTDLALLYESQAQFQDALNCFKKAAKYKPACPEALRARIALLETEVKRGPPANKQKQTLPSLDEAWRLPIPAELTQRQDGFLKMKQEKYVQGSPLLRSELELGLDGKGGVPNFYLTSQQVQMMRILEQNQNQLDMSQANLLRQLQHSFSLMQQHNALVQQANQQRQQLSSKLSGESTSSEGQSALPVLSVQDLMDLVPATSASSNSQTGGDTKQQTAARGSTETDELILGTFGEKDTKHDPMLSSAALTKDQNSRESTQDAAIAIDDETEKPTRVQDSRVSSSSEQRDDNCNTMDTNEPLTASISGHPPGQPPPPPPLNLLSVIKVPTNISSHEILQMCHQRALNPCSYRPIFDEVSSPPVPADPPTLKFPKDRLLLPTPSIVVDSKKDAVSLELQQFCYKQPIALIKGLCTALRLDLSFFSTKTLLDTAPEQQVEIRTQLKMEAEANLDQMGEKTWNCESHRSFTTVAKYAHYQAQSFQHSLKEEQDKLKLSSRNAEERRKEEEMSKIKIIKFGTNVDLSDERRWKHQLHELHHKLPPFCRLIAGCNVLTHLGHTVYGMNTVQLYMKVPGSRTPGHQENNNFASVNINIGPGECEWFGVPYEYWGVVTKLCKKRGLSCLKGSWWPALDDLYDADIPVYRFTQKAGDMVWVGPGTLHWVHATGWCNNIAWNAGPMSPYQIRVAIESYEWNKLEGYKSLVPVQHLTWQLAKNVRFTQVKLFEIIKKLLIRSLAHTQMVLDFAQGIGKNVRHHPRIKGEPAHYCANCEIEVFNVLFVLEQNNKFVVHCCDCARKIDPSLADFTVLQQYTIEELGHIFDSCVLYAQRQNVIS